MGDSSSVGTAGGPADISKLSFGESTICVVELKYRARFGRRNDGGRVGCGIRHSSRDFLTVRLNILINTSACRRQWLCDEAFLSLGEVAQDF